MTEATTRVPAEAVLPPRHPDAPAPGEPIASHYSHCVGCGEDHPTGLKVVVTAGEGLTLSGRFTVTGDHQGAPGLAHGGMLSLAFDEVLGSLVWLVGIPAVGGHHFIEHGRAEDVAAALRTDDVRAAARAFEVNP